jgi:hypothetical protein
MIVRLLPTVLAHFYRYVGTRHQNTARKARKPEQAGDTRSGFFTFPQNRPLSVNDR